MGMLGYNVNHSSIPVVDRISLRERFMASTPLTKSPFHPKPLFSTALRLTVETGEGIYSEQERQFNW